MLSSCDCSKRIRCADSPLAGLRFRRSRKGRLCAIEIAVSNGIESYVVRENARRVVLLGFFDWLEASHFGCNGDLRSMD